MFRFQIDFVDGLTGHEVLDNAPIDGVELGSTLDILINALRGNYVKSFKIKKYCDLPESLSASNQFIFSENHHKFYKKPDHQTQKENFFWVCTQKIPHITEGFIVGDVSAISDIEFQHLFDALKISQQLKSLEIVAFELFPSSFEKNITDVVQNNLSLEKIFLSGCISLEFKNSLAAIEQQRMAIKIYSNNTFTSYSNIPDAIKSYDDNLKRTRPYKKIVESDYYQGGVIAVLGFASISVGIALLNLAILNLQALFLIGAGTLCLGWSSYSFFVSKTSEGKEDLNAYQNPELDDLHTKLFLMTY